MGLEEVELRRQKRSRAERAAALFTALAALITALGAVYKPEVSARRSYDEMSKGLEKLSKDAQQNHDDIVALRNYLDGYTKSRETTPVTVSNTPSSAAGAPAGLGPNTPVLIKPTRPMPEPPTIKNAKSAYVPPPYKQVTGREDTSLF
jgi:hypothetical protein